MAGLRPGAGIFVWTAVSDARLERFVKEQKKQARRDVREAAESGGYRSSSSDALPTQRLSQLQAIYDGAPVGLCFVDRNERYVSLEQTSGGDEPGADCGAPGADGGGDDSGVLWLSGAVHQTGAEWRGVSWAWSSRQSWEMGAAGAIDVLRASAG